MAKFAHIMCRFLYFFRRLNNGFQITSIPFKGTPEQEAELLDFIRAHSEDKGALMPVMQKAQEIYGYLPIEVQKMIAIEWISRLKRFTGIYILLTVLVISEGAVHHICMLGNGVLC